MKKLMRWSAILGGSFLAAAFMLVAGLGMNRMTAAAETGSASGVPETADPEAGPGHELILQGNRYKPSELYERAVILNTEASEGADSQEKEILARIEERCRALLEAEGIRVYSISEEGKEADAGGTDQGRPVSGTDARKRYGHGSFRQLCLLQQPVFPSLADKRQLCGPDGAGGSHGDRGKGAGACGGGRGYFDGTFHTGCRRLSGLYE